MSGFFNSSSASGGGGGNQYPRSNARSPFSTMPIGQRGVNVLAPLYVPATSSSSSASGGGADNQDNLELVTYNKDDSLANLPTPILMVNIQVINKKIAKINSGLASVSADLSIGEVDRTNKEQTERQQLEETKKALEDELKRRQNAAKQQREALMAQHMSDERMKEQIRQEDIAKITRETQEIFDYFKWIALRERWTVDEYKGACDAAISSFTLYQNYIYGIAYLQQQWANIMAQTQNIRDSAITAIRTAVNVVGDTRFRTTLATAGTLAAATRPVTSAVAPNVIRALGTGGIPYLTRVMTRYGLTRFANMTTKFLQNNLYVVLLVALGNVLSFLYTIESNPSGFSITARDYPQLSAFIAEIRQNYNALRESQNQTRTESSAQFAQSQLQQITNLLEQIVNRFPQVANVLSPEVMNTLNSIEITRPNIQAGARMLTHRIIEGATRVGELIGDLYSTINDFFNGNPGFNATNQQQMADLTRLIEEQMEARNIALKHTEEIEANRAAQYASDLQSLAEALTGIIKSNPNSFKGSGSANVSAASSRASSRASSIVPSAASSRASIASSRASVLVGSLGVELSKLSDTNPTLPEETVVQLQQETDELVGYIPLPTEDLETAGASQGSQMSDISMDSSSSEERSPLLEKPLEVNLEQVTAIVTNFNPGPGTISGEITVADQNEQSATVTLQMAVADPQSIKRTQNYDDSTDASKKEKYGGSEDDSDSDLYGGRRKSKRRRNKRQTKKKRSIRRRRRRQTKRRQRRYTKRRVIRKRR